ncbi:hypothetical protein QJQ45_026452 [Haematococcus lacustris]|nr:hypothetical protein QJQ45_026452 [Haematococcus lacustris]
MKRLYMTKLLLVCGWSFYLEPSGVWLEGAFPSSQGDNSQGQYGAGRGAGRAGLQGMPGRGFRGTAENAKTRMCTRWLQGHCRFGEACNFAHGETELRALPPRSPDASDRQDSFGLGGRGRGYPYPGRGMGPSGRTGRGPGYGMHGAPGYGGGYGMEAGQGYGGQAVASQQDEVWANSGFPTHGPNGWVMYKVKETGEEYYHNHKSNITQWDRPVEWP